MKEVKRFVVLDTGAIAGTMKALRNVRSMISRISSSLEMEGEE